MKKSTIFGATLLSIFLLTTFFTTTLAQTGEQNSGSKIPPDMPVDALQYNQTDITPAGYIESVQAMKINVYFYRNFTLMMNSTQNCSLNMTLDPQVNNRLVSMNVEADQTMPLTMNVTASPPKGEALTEQLSREKTSLNLELNY